MAHCSDEAALGVKGHMKSRIPPHLPRLGPTGPSLAPRKQPPAARSLGTAYVPQPVQVVVGRGGRKPTTLSPAQPFGHNCSSTGAKGRRKFSLQRRYPSPCFVSISLPPTGQSEQGGGHKTISLPYSRA